MAAIMVAEAWNNGPWRKLAVIRKFHQLFQQFRPRSIERWTGNIVRCQPSLRDVGRLAKFKMADTNPEVHCISGMEWHIAKIPTALPTFSTMPEPMVIPPTLSDVSRLAKFKMADTKPEVLYISGMEWHIAEIPTATRTFSTLSKSMVTLPTLPDKMKI